MPVTKFIISITPTIVSGFRPAQHKGVFDRFYVGKYSAAMAGRECYHCRQWVEAGSAHDCWTTTEENLTRELPEPLRDAWYRLRETAAAFGEQRIYASHKSIMFSKKACYFFVRPRRADLEVIFFVGRAIKNPLIRKIHPSSKLKLGHLVRIAHRDEVEAPLTDWLKEAFTVSDGLTGRRSAPKKAPAPKKRSAKKKAIRRKCKKPVARR